MRQRPLSFVVGAEITDIDARTASEADLDAIRGALHTHALLSFPGQTLSADDLVHFSSRFGQLQHHVLDQFCLPTHRAIYVISNIVEDGRPRGNPREGFAWHTDLSYMQEPTAYTLLYAVEVPAKGGDTLFASMYAAYDALSPGQKARLSGLQSRRSYAKLTAGRTTSSLTQAQRDRTPEVQHPIVRSHPATGRKALYLGTDDFAGIVGMEEPAGSELMTELVSHALQDRFRYAYRWRAKDLVIWDNRGLMHTATEYDQTTERRLVYRTSVQGERPH